MGRGQGITQQLVVSHPDATLGASPVVIATPNAKGIYWVVANTGAGKERARPEFLAFPGTEVERDSGAPPRKLWRSCDTAR